eukprot:COSAG06_NODE_16007_length_1029_cov_1.402151_2_plen_43_part_01
MAVQLYSPVYLTTHVYLSVRCSGARSCSATTSSVKYLTRLTVA